MTQLVRLIFRMLLLIKLNQLIPVFSNSYYGYQFQLCFIDNQNMNQKKWFTNEHVSYDRENLLLSTKRLGTSNKRMVLVINKFS